MDLSSFTMPELEKNDTKKSGETGTKGEVYRQ